MQVTLPSTHPVCLRFGVILSILSVLSMPPAIAGDSTPLPGTPAPSSVISSEKAPSVAPITFKAFKSDGSYRTTMERWAKEQNWTMSWELPEDDYSFEYNAQFQGDLRVAVNGMCAALNNKGIRARALFYPDNQVFRVVLEGTAQ